MKKSLILKLLCCGALLVGFSTGVFAQATRTWVSGVGDDVNPCSRTAPCKTFAGAISKTAEGGEIDALDPAGYGTLTVSKAMTVDGGTGSGWASVLNSGGIAGFTVNITTGTHVNDAVVILRNITIQGASQAPSLGGLNGINYVKAAQLFVKDCHIENQTGTGVKVNLTGTGIIYLENTDLSNVATGISMTTTAGTAVLEASHISVQGNTNGLTLTSNALAFVADSFFSRNIGGNAMQAGNTCILVVSDTKLYSNSTAINAVAGSQVRINASQIFDNTNGLAGNASSFQSGGNNKLGGNGASVAPTGPPLTTQ
ncbi:MAG: hypothetical protein QOI07_2744 [Verrucomicrobiota bacterium]|jgi:hypothetical protein